jgi:hypothetical protein
VTRVRISTVVCNTGFGSSDQPGLLTSRSPCDSSAGGPSGTYAGQYLVGYMIPEGSNFPTTLTSADLPGNTFSLSDSYAAALQAQQGAQAGMQWVGYISDTVTVTQNEVLHIDADFSLPAQAGVPFSGPLHTTEVIGDREVDATYLADRPVDCSESRRTAAPPGLPQTEYLTSCIEDTATTDSPRVTSR